jgi:CRP/FNR family transcriptional regulator, anaerobic regulatory protein
MATRQVASIDTNASKVFEKICAQGSCLVLRAQKRVPLPPANKLIVLREGMLAIDAMPAKGKLQVLDFMAAGDVISMSTMLSTSRISLRAITTTELFMLDDPEVFQTVPVHECWQFLIGRCFRQLARLNIHQLMIGRLETEARVASFILAFALRNVRERTLDDTAQIPVTLPMSRVDIANYLVINCDTLSRTMMRFCDCGLIERVSRHAIRVIDFNALKHKSPISSLLSEVFMKMDDDQEGTFRLVAEGNILRHRANVNGRLNSTNMTVFPSVTAAE